MKTDKNKALKALLIYCLICLMLPILLYVFIHIVLGWQKFD